MDEKILYLDCASGISGDMTIGALLDLGASREKLVRALDSLGVSGYHLHFGRTKKCGIDAYDFDVHLEEEEHHHDHEHGHEHEHSMMSTTMSIITIMNTLTTMSTAMITLTPTTMSTAMITLTPRSYASSRPRNIHDFRDHRSSGCI